VTSGRSYSPGEDSTSRGSLRLLCSTGAFTRDCDRPDHTAILEVGPQLAVDGLEVIVYAPWYPALDQVQYDLQTSGLCFPVVHAEKSIGPAFGSDSKQERRSALDKLATNCRFAHAIGTELLVLHLWGLPDGDAHIERNLAALPACYEVAGAHGISLAIETIPCDSGTPLERMRQAIETEDGTLVALDTEFLAYHNQLDEAVDADWLWDRVRHIHLKDYDGMLWSREEGRRYLHPGQGHIDFPKVFRKLRQREFGETMSLKASGMNREGIVDLARVQQSLALLRGWMEDAASWVPPDDEGEFRIASPG